MKFRSFATGLVGVTLIGAAGLGTLLWRNHARAVRLPEPTGEYSVGRVHYEWIDDTRVDSFAPTAGVKRDLPVWIWYPADKLAEQPESDYLPLAVRDALRIDSVLRFIAVDTASVRSHTLADAPLASAPAVFPVVLFKPGRGAAVSAYSAMAEDLASHGYVVVGSDSPYTTGRAVYPDGRALPRSATGAPPESAPGNANELTPGQPNDLALPVLAAWVSDKRFLLDELRELDARDDGLFAHRLDLEAVGAFGHSFGGAAALQFCASDARCKAGIDMDGAPLGEVLRTGLSKPFLFLLSDRPVLRVSPAERRPDEAALLGAIERVRARLPNQPTQIILHGTAHWNFSDQALFTEAHLARLFGQVGPIDQRRALVVASRYVRAFFDTHLKGQRDALLDGPSAAFPEALLQQ